MTTTVIYYINSVLILKFLNIQHIKQYILKHYLSYKLNNTF